MTKLARNAFLLLLVFTAGVVVKTLIDQEFVGSFISENWERIIVFSLISLLAVAAILFLAYQILRSFVLRRFNVDLANSSETQMVTGIVETFTNPKGLENPTLLDRQKAALVNAGLWVVRRQATQFYAWILVTFLGGIVGTATVILLQQQNEKLDAQNSQIRLQTEANIANAVLLEGARRASMSQDMFDLLETVRVEADQAKSPCDARRDGTIPCRFELILESDYPVPAATVVATSLTQKTTLRLQGFAEQSTPYITTISRGIPLDMEIPLSDQIDFRELSTERGLLFRELAQNDIFTFQINFSRAHLLEAKLTNVKAMYSELRYADFSAAVLDGANLIEANLNNANFEAASLQNTNLIGAKMIETNLKRSNLAGANLTGADLSRATLLDAQLREANLSGAALQDIIFDDGIEGAPWAWSDDPPMNIPNGFLEISICEFDKRKDERWRKPVSC